MRTFTTTTVLVGAVFIATAAVGAQTQRSSSAQTTPSASAQTQPSSSTASEVYHVHFTKAAPGQAMELAKALSTPTSTGPMADHFVVLRHQEGDDWDYVVIQHLGPKTTVDAAPAPTDPSRDMRAWHSDTFVAGPPWAEFTRAMGIGEAAATGAVYTVGVHRPVPGHRAELEKALSAPPVGKVQTGNLLLRHLEGADWTFLAITRYNSWQDFATDRMSAMGAPSGSGGWAEIRRHSAFHRDTVADRIFPAK